MRWLAFALLIAVSAAHGQEPANGILLVARPGLVDPNFRQSVVLVTQAADASTVGVILNRPTARKHEQTGEVIYTGGPVMREVLLALFRAPREPEGSAFHVLKDVYLSMDPRNIEMLLQKRSEQYRLFAGFAGWAPGQLESEMRRDGWYMLPASADLVFRADTAGMWDYSPELFGESPHAWFGPKPAFWPDWLPFSAALLILPFPGLFRFTCYYYRGAYYKAFWSDPPSCAVGEPRKSYWGEASFPLILQNVHRYFLYFALLFIVVLTYDVWVAMWFEDPATGGKKFGIGLGTIILAINVVLLSGYTFGCHSLRHLIGGRHDELSRKGGAQMSCYNCVSGLNRRHMLFAWCSLFSVAFSDVYVRLVAMGIWSDWRLF